MKFKAWLKKYLLTGLIVVVPITITLYIIRALMGVMDDFLTVVPKAYHPDTLLGFHVPGLGLVLVTLLVFLIGLLTRSYVGNKTIQIWDLLIGRIPSGPKYLPGDQAIYRGGFQHQRQSF